MEVASLNSYTRGIMKLHETIRETRTWMAVWGVATLFVTGRGQSLYQRGIRRSNARGAPGRPLQ